MYEYIAEYHIDKLAPLSLFRQGKITGKKKSLSNWLKLKGHCIIQNPVLHNTCKM